MKEVLTELICNVYTGRSSSTRIVYLVSIVLAIIANLCCCYIMVFKDVTDYSGLSEIMIASSVLMLLTGSAKVLSDKFQGDALGKNEDDIKKEDNVQM